MKWLRRVAKKITDIMSHYRQRTWKEKFPKRGRFAANGHEAKKEFYQHLQVYLLMNVFFIVMGYRYAEIKDTFAVTFFWGLGVLMHYLRVFGWPSHPPEGASSAAEEELELPPLTKSPPEPPRWEERDLV